MPSATDPSYLLQQQYRNATNLNARIALHARISTNPYGWHRWVFDQFTVSAVACILELGCGPGTMWLLNRNRIPFGWNVTLSDFSAGMVEEARCNLAGINPSFTFEQIDAQSISFPDVSADAVIANHMLYHVLDRNRAFAEVRRVLKPGGTFYAATNGHDHLREIHELQERFGIPGLLGAALNEFSLENGEEQLKSAFGQVCLRRYDDALRITEAEPLVAFILSQSGACTTNDARIEALRIFVDAELAQKGAIHVTKSTGLYIAS
jgi:SAM-dependent methyltransferase